MNFWTYLQELNWLFILLTFLFAGVSYFLWKKAFSKQEGPFIVMDTFSMKEPISFRTKKEAKDYCRLANIRTSKGVIKRFEVMVCSPINTIK